jgi:hypothetical protein
MVNEMSGSASGVGVFKPLLGLNPNQIFILIPIFLIQI